MGFEFTRAIAFLACAVCGCSGFTNLANDGTGDLDSGAVPDADSPDAGGVGCEPATCGGAMYECGNCDDDDDDGLLDSMDPDCLGACDNNEAGYLPNLPGGPPRCRRDCFFDRGSGGPCDWDLGCDPADPGGGLCMTPPRCPSAQDAECVNDCVPLVPNGCDCFGCCAVPGDSTNYVFVGSIDMARSGTCDSTRTDDPTACRPCTPVMDCFNPCDHCELCVGKPFLPADCTGATPECVGRPACGSPGLPPCPGSQFCSTGCCTFFG